MALTKEYIVIKSIEILNRDGFDGLTMRVLAKELDIKAASLYWHFKDKAELYAAISESMCEKIIVPSGAIEPAELISDIFRQFRETLLSVTGSVPVFENSVPFTPARMALIRAVSNSFLALGVKPENLVTVSNMFNNYVLSFVADECRFKSGSGERFSGFADGLAPRDRLIFTVSQDFDGQFSYGLKLLFAGLARTK